MENNFPEQVNRSCQESCVSIFSMSGILQQKNSLGRMRGRHLCSLLKTTVLSVCRGWISAIRMSAGHNLCPSSEHSAHTCLWYLLSLNIQRTLTIHSPVQRAEVKSLLLLEGEREIAQRGAGVRASHRWLGRIEVDSVGRGRTTVLGRPWLVRAERWRFTITLATGNRQSCYLAISTDSPSSPHPPLFSPSAAHIEHFPPLTTPPRSQDSLSVRKWGKMRKGRDPWRGEGENISEAQVGGRHLNDLHQWWRERRTGNGVREKREMGWLAAKLEH